MYILFTILIVIAAILLTLLVLVQNSKGGGLAAGFNSGNQVMGVRKTTDFLEKATWSLIIFIVLCAILAVGASKGSQTVDANHSAISTQVQEQAEQTESLAGYNEATEEVEK